MTMVHVYTCSSCRMASMTVRVVYCTLAIRRSLPCHVQYTQCTCIYNVHVYTVCSLKMVLFVYCSEVTMKRLLDNMFCMDTPSDVVIISGVSVLLTAIERRLSISLR